MSSTSSSVGGGGGGGGSNSDRRNPRPVGGSGVGACGENENLACPRCNSNNTKFCYYNNYNLSQPRYFCKSCRRYWTQGGTLRNIPVGGGNRKSAKRSRTSSSTSSSTASSNASSHQETKTIANSVSTNVGYKLPDVSVPFFNVSGSGSFTSLLNSQGSGSSMGTGSGLWTVGQDELGVGLEEMGGFGLGLGQRRGGWPLMEYVGEGYAGSSWQLGSYVDGGDHCFAWPELAISTPTEGISINGTYLVRASSSVLPSGKQPSLGLAHCSLFTI